MANEKSLPRRFYSWLVPGSEPVARSTHESLRFCQAKQTQRFEYKIIAMPKVPSDDGMKENTDAFNKLGNEGGDLADSEGGFYYIFKRSK